MTNLASLVGVIFAGLTTRAILERVGEHRKRRTLLKALQAAVRSVRSSLSATLRASYGAMRRGTLPGMPVPAAPSLLTNLRLDDLRFLPHREAELASEVITKLHRLFTFRDNVNHADEAGNGRSDNIREKEVRDYTHLLTTTLEDTIALQNSIYRLTRRRTLVQVIFGRRR